MARVFGSVLRCISNFVLFASVTLASNDHNQFDQVVIPTSDFIWPILQHLTTIQEHVLQAKNVSQECQKDLLKTISGLKHFKNREFKLLDSFSKINPGLYQDTLVWNVGHEEQCLKLPNTSFSILEIQVPYDEHDKVLDFTFGDRFIQRTSRMSQIMIPWFALAHGFCHPASCSAYDLGMLLDLYFGHTLDFNIKNQNRSLKQVENFWNYMALATIVVILALNLLATLGLGPSNFNVIRNWGILRQWYEKEKLKKSPTDFLNGYKTIYFIVSVFLHSSLIFNVVMIQQYSQLIQYNKSNTIIYDYSAIYVVSGMAFNTILTSAISVISWSAYATKLKAKNKSIPFKLFIMSRFFRILPILFFTICIILAAPLLSSTGSYLKYNPLLQSMADGCLKTGWREILFIGNTVHCSEICVAVGWFLSMDFQLNFSFFLLISALLWNMEHGFLMAVGLLLVSFISLILWNTFFMRGEEIISTFAHIDSFDQIHEQHFATKNYVIPFICGLVLGALIHHKRKLSILTRYSNLVAMGALIIILPILSFTKDINEWERSSKIHAMPFVQFSLSLALTLHLYAIWAVPADRNILKRFLNLNFHKLISRILLPSFLIHALIIVWLTTYFTPEGLYIGPLMIHIIGKTIFALPCGLILGLILHLLVEMPFMSMTSSLLEK